MRLECARCQRKALAPFLEGVSLRQDRINSTRRHYMEALQRQDKDEASSIALSLEEIGASIEATRDDEPSSGKLVQSMIANLLKATHLLEARREVDPQKVNEAELALKKAEGEMKMLAAGVHPELKQTFEQSLVEFGAAAMIARSDDLEITRERALEEINRGLGR